MKNLLRISALALALVCMTGAAVVTPPVEACTTTYYSYAEGNCWVTEIHNSCSSCYDVQIECPNGESEDVVC